MREDSGNRTPKTLADVSHLFFSSTENQAEEPPMREAGKSPASATGGSDESASAQLLGEGRTTATRLFLVTGSDAAPGKSTIAVNLAHALLNHGRVGLYDADPHVPNARFYLGLPSWNYLSPIAGGGESAPDVLTDHGLIVVDWSTPERVERPTTPAIAVSVPSAGTHVLDFAVVDAPLATAVSMAADSTASLVVVGEPGLRGFERTFGVLAALARGSRAREAGIAVNRVPDLSYARAYCAKMRLACQRLLSMDASFLGGLVCEPGIGSLQRERGVLVRASQDAALLLKEMAANALDLRGAAAAAAERPAAPV